MQFDGAGIGSKLSEVPQTQPADWSLLEMSVFYSWLYLRRSRIEIAA